MLLIKLNVSRCVMYDKLAAGKINNGKGTVFHCAPAFSVTSHLTPRRKPEAFPYTYVCQVEVVFSPQYPFKSGCMSQRKDRSIQ